MYNIIFLVSYEDIKNGNAELKYIGITYIKPKKMMKEFRIICQIIVICDIILLIISLLYSLKTITIPIAYYYEVYYLYIDKLIKI